MIKVKTKTFKYKVNADKLEFRIQNYIFRNFENLNSKCLNISQNLPYLLAPTLTFRPSCKVILYFSSSWSPCSTNLPAKDLLIDTHIGYFTTYSKWPYLAIMAILEAISYLLMVRKSFFKDWILIYYIEPHKNLFMQKGLFRYYHIWIHVPHIFNEFGYA